LKLPWAKPLPLGAEGERLAVRELKRAGYRILDRNLVLGRYEIDIVAQEGDTIAFVEVKTRRTDHLVVPEANLTYQKRQHIFRAARHYMARRHDPTMYYRFDVVAIVWPENEPPRVNILRDAFRDE
jgi:putative endonuclease